MDNVKERYYKTLPSVYKTQSNFVWNALICALANSQEDIFRQILISKEQNFVKTATGTNLDILSNSLGVSRPSVLGLTDEEFRKLIPNLSLKPKLIKKAFYDVADIFFGELLSRANTISLNFEPFNLNLGDGLSFKIDNGPVQTVKVLPGDIAVPGSATAEEVVLILSKIKNMTSEVSTDPVTGNNFVSIRTNTPGSVGSIEPISSSGIGPGNVNFTLKEFDILDLDQRVSIYNINPNELIIELPAIIPALKRTLLGSHHLHVDATLEPPKGTDQGIWKGSFLYDTAGIAGSFSISSERTTLLQNINKGSIYNSVTVDDASVFTNKTGKLIFNFGKDSEFAVGYRDIPNNNTILLDPSYVFQKDHIIGDSINFLNDQRPHTPKISGTDFGIYLTSPSSAREVVQEILDSLKAAGIIIKFEILAPKYKYLIDNPYISSDDPPSCD